MSPQLESIIKETQELDPDELRELMKAISGILRSKHRMHAKNNDFWNPKTLNQIIEEQNAKALNRLSDFVADFWPDEESVDEFIKYIYEQRREDRLSS